MTSEEGLTRPDMLEVAIAASGASGEYRVEAHDPATGAYLGPETIIEQNPTSITQVLGLPGEATRIAERLTCGQIAFVQVTLDVWAALMELRDLRYEHPQTRVTMFADRYAEQPFPAPPRPEGEDDPGVTLRSVLESPAGICAWPDAPAFVTAVDTVHRGESVARVILRVPGGFSLDTDAFGVLRTQDDDWDHDHDILLPDLGLIGRVRVYPLDDTLVEWWRGDLQACIDTGSKRVVGVLWMKDSGMLERVDHRWHEPEEIDSLDGTALIRVHPQFVAAFDLAEYLDENLSIEDAEAYQWAGSAPT